MKRHSIAALAALSTPLAAMNVVVGSENPIKVDSVREVFADYNGFKEALVSGKDVGSGVREQPLALEEMIRGARNRAERAKAAGDIGVGIESGLMPLPGTTEWVDLCVVSIFDGKKHHLGMSNAFQVPPMIVKLMTEEGLDFNQAAQRVGLSKKQDLGKAEGAIGVLTDGRINRQAYTKQALITALVSIDKAEWFSGS